MTKSEAIQKATERAAYLRQDRVVFCQRTPDGLVYGETGLATWHGQGNAPIERARICPTLGRRTAYYVQTVEPAPSAAVQRVRAALEAQGITVTEGQQTSIRLPARD